MCRIKKCILLSLISASLFCACGKNTAEPQQTAPADEAAAVEDNTAAADEQTAAADPAADAQTETVQTDTAMEADSAQRDLFADFIMGKGIATVSEQYLSAFNMLENSLPSTESFTVSELEEALAKNEMIGDNPAKVAYAPVWCHDLQLYALQLYYESDVEAPMLTYIFREEGDRLEIVFGIDSWSRRNAFVNEYGIIRDDGADGAGSHMYTTYGPDTKGVYQLVTDVHEKYYGYAFYDDNGNPEEALNATIEESAAKSEAAQNVVYYKEIINDKPYYYFLGVDKITQKTVDLIDGVAASHNFKFDGKAAADEARTAREQELNLEEEIKSEKEATWKEL